jgi:hypothetical protein
MKRQLKALPQQILQHPMELVDGGTFRNPYSEIEPCHATRIMRRKLERPKSKRLRNHKGQGHVRTTP